MPQFKTKNKYLKKYGSSVLFGFWFGLVSTFPREQYMFLTSESIIINAAYYAQRHTIKTSQNSNEKKSCPNTHTGKIYPITNTPFIIAFKVQLSSTTRK